MTGGAASARALRLPQQPQPEILRHVRILILVHQDVSEPLLILPQHLRMRPEQPDAFEQQVAEVRRVERLQPLLIRGVELLALAAAEARAFAGRHLLGRQPAVLPAIDELRQHAAGPALLIQILNRDQLLHQPDLVVGVEDGEVLLQAHQLGMAAQDLHADGMEGAEPRHALDDLADHAADALLHLARRLVGEGDREDLGRARAAGRQDVGDARGEHARLAGAGAREHQHRTIQRHHRFALLRVEIVQVIRLRAVRHRARGNPARLRIGRQRVVIAREIVRLSHHFSELKRARARARPKGESSRPLDGIRNPRRRGVNPLRAWRFCAPQPREPGA